MIRTIKIAGIFFLALLTPLLVLAAVVRVAVRPKTGGVVLKIILHILGDVFAVFFGCIWVVVLVATAVFYWAFGPNFLVNSMITCINAFIDLWNWTWFIHNNKLGYDRTKELTFSSVYANS